MRFSPLLLLAAAGSSAASATASTTSSAASVGAAQLHACLVQHSTDLADYADCGDASAIDACLAKLPDASVSHVQDCFAQPGCPLDTASYEARQAVARCDDALRSGAELKKRYGDMPVPRADTTDGPKSTGGVMSGTDCFTTGKKKTTDCELITTSGRTKTGTCTPTEVTTSKCGHKLLCTLDSNNDDICMVRKDMDTGGIIVLIVFCCIFFGGVATLTFMCCKEKKEQKRLMAKSEAVALARAATRKQRAKQDRAPLMRNVSADNNSNAGSNPFQDQNRV